MQSVSIHTYIYDCSNFTFLVFRAPCLMTKNESYDNQKKLIELLMDHCVSLDAYLDFTDVHQQAKY